MKHFKRILIVTSEFPPQPGGIGNHAYNIAKHLSLNDFNIDVISDNRSSNGQEEYDFDSGLPFKVYRVLRRRLRFWMYLNRLQFLFKLIKNTDIVIASGKFSIWSVAFSSLFFNRGYFAVIHGSEVNFPLGLNRHFINLSLKRYSKIIAVSSYTKSLVSHINYNHVSVIPNGIEISEWSEPVQDIKGLSGTPKLITVGRVSHRKGQLHVIKHLVELIKIYPKIHYHCIGIPTEKDLFLDKAAE